MSQFARLIETVADPKTLVSAALLQAKVVAWELPVRKARTWVSAELDGYNCHAKELPPYRKVRAILKGHFIGSFGSELRNATLPTNHFDEDIAEAYDTQAFGDGVGKLEALTQRADDYLHLKLSDSLFQFYCRYPGVIAPGMQLVEAIKICPMASIVGILHSVRSRLLDFLLELKDRHPELLKKSEAISNLPPDEVASALQHTIFQGCTFQGDLDMSSRDVNVGGNMTAGRDIVIAGKIRDSFNTVAGSSAPPDLKDLMRTLSDQVQGLAQKLDPEKAKEVAQDFETLASEAAKPQPRKKWYEMSAQGLIEAAKSVQEFAVPIATTVSALLPLLAKMAG